MPSTHTACTGGRRRRGLLDLGHPLAVGEDDLLVDVAEIDLAGDVEAWSTSRCWNCRSTLPRSIVSSPLLRSSAFESPVSTLEIVVCAARLASTHSVLNAGLAVKRLAAGRRSRTPRS
jgi:hypothetical protein